MAVVDLQSILDRIEILNTGETKDLYISLLEDLTDSFGGAGNTTDEIETLKLQMEDLEKKAEEIEETWRNKYIARFKQPADTEKKEEEKEEEEKEEEKDYFSEEEIKEEWKNG